ncbi:MAG: CIA30 family protein, partial [Thermosynechococcaceae cyanobacterium]
MSEPARQPWNIGRFMQTLTYFEALPIVNWFQKMLPAFMPPVPPQIHAGLIFDFQQPAQDLAQTWGVLDDVVMGGASASSFKPQAEAALFSGIVTTANSGGFASVRTRSFEPPIDLSSHIGIELQVKGDGQRYKFLMRDQESWDSIAYAQSFDTAAGEWQRIRILSSFGDAEFGVEDRRVNSLLSLARGTFRIFSSQPRSASSRG